MKRSELEQIENELQADEPVAMTFADKRAANIPLTKQERIQEFKEGMSQVASLGTDLLPFIGTAKAASELPDDIEYVQDLLAAGYEEGDIKKMGLGAGLGALTALGFIPGVKIAADVGKRAIQEGIEEAADELGTQTRRAFGQEALITPQRRKQLDAAKELPANERRKFLENINRPTPRVFHGAGSMNNPMELGDKFTSKLKAQQKYGIEEPLVKTGASFLGFDASSDKYIEKVNNEAIFIPVTKRDGEFDPIYININKNNEGDIEIREMPNYPDSLESGKIIKKIGASTVKEIDNQPKKRAQILSSTLINELRDVSKELSYDGLGHATRKEMILKQGFDPFDDVVNEAGETSRRKFEGAEGMAGRATGNHMELGKKLLSTSFDPNVSMKPAFGGLDTRNIVYARVPREQIRDMSPDQYAAMAAGMDYDSKVRSLDLEDTQIGYRLPKTTHTEDELAVQFPEQLDVQDLETEGAQEMITRGATLDAPSPEFVGPMKRVGEDKSLKDVVEDRTRKYTELYSLIDGRDNFSLDSVDPRSRHKGVKLIPVDSQGKSRERNYAIDKENLFAFKSAADQRQGYNNVKNFFRGALSESKTALGMGTGDSYDDLMDLVIGDFRYPEAYANSLTQTIKTLGKTLPDGERKDVMRSLDYIGSIGYDFNKLIEDNDILRTLDDEALLSLIKDKANKNLDKAPDLVLKDFRDDFGKVSRGDIKRMIMLLTEKMNRGGLVSPR
jgi:hypothetical protein